SRHRLVITIGLETITHNKDAVAIIFAAGEAKAGIVKDALESEPSVLFDDLWLIFLLRIAVQQKRIGF
ncbi:MAG TPA: hypothetical protein VHO90_00190, partial [Bacteroidales bacterium]|nr:hypothetical protein [Bacteroidales bacterium]